MCALTGCSVCCVRRDEPALTPYGRTQASRSFSGPCLCSLAASWPVVARGGAETPRQLPRRASCPRWVSPWPRTHVLDPGCMAGAGAQRARVSLAPEEGALVKPDKER